MVRHVDSFYQTNTVIDENKISIYFSLGEITAMIRAVNALCLWFIVSIHPRMETVSFGTVSTLDQFILFIIRQNMISDDHRLNTIG